MAGTEAPILDSRRLRLRPLQLADAAEIQRLAGDKRIADTTLRIPHPYGDGAAEAMISGSLEDWERRTGLRLAITERQGGELLGIVSLKLNLEHDGAELGYWVGVPHWGRGYASEAAQTLVDYGFSTLGLHRIEAFCMRGNQASARILEKVGMRHEGTQRDGIKKWGVFHDTEIWGVLRHDLEEAESATR